MPTSSQVQAAKISLAPQPYDANASKLSADAQAQLLVHLRKYLSETGKSAGYPDISTKLNDAVGIKAAQLQAVLDNVDTVGSKVAELTGEVEYSTDVNIRSELEFALYVMYEPVGRNRLGTAESDMAKAIRGGCRCGQRTCRCCADEYRLTTSNC